jgi:hypothetical protein
MTPDLCVSAALDAVKEKVYLPWVTTSSNLAAALQIPGASNSSTTDSSQDESQAKSTKHASQQLASSLSSPEIFVTEGAAASEAADAQAKPISSEPSVPDPSVQPRMLYLRNFTKALKEIQPSSSESQGSLTELRKWNEEFGEGRQTRKRQQVWGRGRFGFVEDSKNGEKGDEAKVISTTSLRPIKSQILDMLDQE